MKVHCRSKNDDLGEHFLNPKDDYKFSFCDNIFLRTVFSCNLSWGNKEADFKAFTSEDSYDICIRDICTWEARPDGIYVSDRRSGGFIKMYDWKKH
ncbi:hypothetical protein ACS0TY_000646 [Phlomoides rotata]